MSPDYTPYENKCHGGHDHHSAVLISVLVAPLGDDTEAHKAAAAQQFAHERYNDENPHVAEAVAQTVQKRVKRTIAHGVGLESSHKNTVGDNQSDIDRQRHADVVGEGLEEGADQPQRRVAR